MAAATQDGVDRSAVRASPAPARQPPDADASSETSSVHSGETSDRRDADILTLVLSTRSEEYRLLFRLPPDEVLVQDFNCAFQENILLQGHMYLFIHHICFYSNIFGFETKKTIHFREVTCVRKAKTAAIFHNAIEIVAGGKKHFFGSFLSRDEAYRLIIDGWAQHNSEIKAFQENQDLKSEISSQENDMVCPKGSRLLGDDPSSSGRTKDDIIWNEPKISPIGEVDGKLTINITEDKENGREENTKLLITENTLTWIVEDVDAPKVPDHFTVVAEAKFPVLVEDFFSFFVSDNSFKFVEDFHKTCGDKDFQCTPWQKHEQFGHVRDVSFLHPIKVYLGAKSGHCQEVQKYRVYKNSHLMIETSQQIGDVPFGDYFHVEGIWDVEEDNDGKSCTLRVYSNVAFSKKTIFRGFNEIDASTRIISPESIDGKKTPCKVANGLVIAEIVSMHQRWSGTPLMPIVMLLLILIESPSAVVHLLKLILPPSAGLKVLLTIFSTSLCIGLQRRNEDTERREMRMVALSGSSR